MKENYAKALHFVLQAEGGYSNDAGDPGGATMHGVTHSEYDKYRQFHCLPAQDVRKITDAEVSDIYKHNYWDVQHGDTLPWPLDAAVFDCAVNQGNGAVRVLLGQIGDLHAPGAAGKLIGLREARYKRLATARPSMAKFLKGWLNRMTALRKFCGIG